MNAGTNRNKHGEPCYRRSGSRGAAWFTMLIPIRPGIHGAQGRDVHPIRLLGRFMALTLSQFQDRIRLLYGAKDARRGVEGTFMWFMEEVGELSAALRSGPKDELAAEFADV